MSAITDQLKASLAVAKQDPQPAAPLVTADQLDLVKKTVAQGATDAELKLYLYDCARQGVHPLDRMIHFTKRGGKYTPITSIDFMRTRAADSGDYAGSDDAVFDADGDHIFAATVTVWRLVQGQRCAFTATARWSEYKPAENDFMWKRMPHTMLAKCAEALALRKGFPRQLAGLYAKEELDQAGPSTSLVIEAPAVPRADTPVSEIRENAAAPTAGDSPSATSSQEAYRQDGLVRIRRIDRSPTRNPNVTKTLITFSTGETADTINEAMANLAEQLCQDAAPVTFTTQTTKWGEKLVTLQRDTPEPVIDIHADMPTDSDIPF